MYNNQEEIEYVVDSFDDILRKSRFTIFHLDARDSLTRSRVDRDYEIRNLLIAAGAQEPEVSRLNLCTNTDIDLVEYISRKMGGLNQARPPFVFYHQNFLGDNDTVKRMYESGKLQELLSQKRIEITHTNNNLYMEDDMQPSGPLNSEPDPPTQLRLIDSLLEFRETISSYFNPFAWWRSYFYIPVEKNQPILTVNAVHTNWYGRNQRRTFKFYPESFQRMHPNGDVRAKYGYEEIKNMKLLKLTCLVIEYSTSNVSPDWISASSDEISDIIKFLGEKQIPVINE